MDFIFHVELWIADTDTFRRSEHRSVDPEALKDARRQAIREAIGAMENLSTVMQLRCAVGPHPPGGWLVQVMDGKETVYGLTVSEVSRALA